MLKKILILDLILLLMLGLVGVLYKIGVITFDKAEAPEPIAEEEVTVEEEETLNLPPEVDETEWSLILANPWNEIPEGYFEDVDIVSTEDGWEVDSRIKESLEKMMADCREAGYNPQIISAFRTRGFQQSLYDSTANKNDTAYPGTSEHELGLALDIIDAASAGWGDPLVKEQEDTEAQKWLMDNCQNYGFILRYPADKEDITGIIYEPWHYRYVGEEHAKKITESGQCLEEYLGRIENDKEKIGSE